MTPSGPASPRFFTLISRFRPVPVLSTKGSCRQLQVQFGRLSSSPASVANHSRLYSTPRGSNEALRSPSLQNIKRRLFSTMSTSKQEQTSTPPTGERKKEKKPPAALRPSSSILLLSPTNQVLLLHRVQTSTSFASAHVFPGGNLSSFHESPLPALDTPEMHQDGPAYRLAAIRETFEESGILLARKPGQSRDEGLLEVPDDVLQVGRKLVHGNQAKFSEWVKNLGGEPDIDNLIPFTRWITPPGPPKRFTTQMYLYMLPLSSSGTNKGSQTLPAQHQTVLPAPTHDGGLEHTAATFDNPHAWLARARSNDIILFPPQFYLLHLISAFIPASQQSQTETEYQSQRSALLTFLHRTPTSSEYPADATKTHLIPWSEKVMSPAAMFVRQKDGRLVLGLEKPGQELLKKGWGRGGDWERVVLVRFTKEGPRDVEVKGRGEVLEEEREADGEGKGEGAKL